ncbi:MAG: hypothetical protein K8I82_22655, partial [Anaerolineae bacterium]|nr:hypothetical protein [Anaerolineae bacterium]
IKVDAAYRILNLEGLEMSEVYEPKVKYVPSEPQSKNNTVFRGCMLLGCAVMFLCCFSVFGMGAGVAALGATIDANEQKVVKTERLAVESDDVNLRIENAVGDIKINGSRSANDIEIELELKATGMTEERAKERLDNITYEVERDGDVYYIRVDEDKDTGFLNKIGNSHINITVTVPEILNVTVTNNVGDIDISNVVIDDKLDLTTDVGEVSFAGQIGPKGDHSITTSVGAIEVRVTRDSSFHLEASSDVGDVKTDLDLANDRSNQEVVSQQVEGDYGSDSPEATLTLVSEVGEIKIRD